MRAFVRRVSLLPFARSVSFLPQNFVSNRRGGHWPSAFCRGYGAWKPSPDGGWLSTFHRHCEISAHTGVVTEGNACGAIRPPRPYGADTSSAPPLAGHLLLKEKALGDAQQCIDIPSSAQPTPQLSIVNYQLPIILSAVHAHAVNKYTFLCILYTHRQNHVGKVALIVYRGQHDGAQAVG